MKYLKNCSFVLVLIFLSLQLTAQKVTISGYVSDGDTGEELVGATVYISSLSVGTYTNAYGFYSFEFDSKDPIKLSASSVGYTTITQDLGVLTNDTTIKIKLLSTDNSLDEVVVSAEKKDSREPSAGLVKINMKQLKALPSAIGEPDIIKSVQKQPGIVSVGEGTSGYFVRGGSADQNQVIIDEANIYDPSHLFGLFSVFNSDVIRSANLYKGGISSQYGGRLSSFLDISTKDGNNREYHGSGGVGLILAKLMVEGPIKEDEASFIVSGRRSYLDIFQRMATDKMVNQNLVSFYDLNAKVNWKPSEKDRMFLGGYFGRDNYKLGESSKFGWGNATGTFRWNHLFSNKLFSNLTLVYSQFQYSLGIGGDAMFDWNASNTETQAKIDFDWFSSKNSKFEFGYKFSYNGYLPSEIEPTSNESTVNPFKMDEMFAMENALYFNHELTIREKLTLQYGLRYTYFANIGPYDQRVYEDPQNNIDPSYTIESYDNFDIIKAFNNFEPRISLLYLLGEDFSFKASYDRTNQNIHLISNGSLPLPFNTWQPSSMYIDPQEADQFAIGFFKDLGYDYSFSASAFYKKFNNITAFADNTSVFFNEDISTAIRSGEGDAKGLEFNVQKNSGSLQGQISYTLSKAEQTIPGVNNNRTFAASHDRRHVLNIDAVYTINDKLTVGATWQYGSGRPFTMPTGKYMYNGQPMYYYSERNGYKLPDFHRLDASLTYVPNPKSTKKWKGEWVFSVINLYNRKNPFTVMINQDSEDGVYSGETTAEMIYLFPILPTVSYNFKF